MYWKFKKCPRCAGDLFLDGFWGNESWTCLQCGYAKPIIRNINSKKTWEELVESVLIENN